MKLEMTLPSPGILHDLQDVNLKRDIRFFRQWLSGHKGTVLEINARTGRITIPLIQDGYQVTALDDDASLLTHLAEKTEHLDSMIQQRLTLWHAELAHLRSENRWSRIILPGNGLCNFLTDDELELALRNLHDLLTPRGRGMLAILNPDPALLNPVPVWQHSVSTIQQDTEIRCSKRRHYDRWQQILTTETRWFFTAGGETVENIQIQKQRILFPRELPVLLKRAGLKVTRVLGDWDGRPPSSDCANQLIEFSRGRKLS